MMMKAVVFVKPGKIEVAERPIPKAGPGEVVIKVSTTTICGTDIHIMKGEYPVSAGRIIGHEAIGTVYELGPGVTGYYLGQRVLVGAITPCGQCYSCLDFHHSQCGGKTMGGWRLGNTIDGCQAEYFVAPHAMANLAVIPDELSDEQVLLCPDIMSTGFAGAENGQIKIGDCVVVFAQGPIGLLATVGAKLKGASKIIVVDKSPRNLSIARELGADVTIDYTKCDAIAEIMKQTKGMGADVAIEALGTQQTFDSCLRSLKPGGTLSSLGVYSGKLSIAAEAFAAGLGDYKIVTSLCPGGKERMRRMISVIQSGHISLLPLITHRFTFNEIEKAYDLFANKHDGVVKVAITMNK